MNAAAGPAGGSGLAKAPRAAPRPAATEDFAAAVAAEEGERRRARRRTRIELLCALGVVAVLLCVERIPAFLLALAVVQTLAWPVYRARARRPRGPGSPKLSPTTLGRAWFVALWVLLLGTVFLEGRAARLLVSFLLAATAAAAPAARANAMRARLSRRSPERARVGAPTDLSYSLEVAGRRPAVGLVVSDAIGPSARPSAVEAFFDAVEGHGRSEVSATITYERRGWRRSRPAVVSTRHPLGLFVASVETVAPAEVLVHPREGKPTAALLDRLRGGTASSGRLVSAHAGSDHFFGLREFREGDDPRRVHWRTTAKRQVKTYVERREEQARRVTVALGTAAEHGPAEDVRFERAVSTAATVLRACVRTGIPARLALGSTGPEGERGIVVRGRRGLLAALDALAILRASAPRRPEAALDRLERSPTTETLIWVGARPEPEVARRASAARGRGGSLLHLRADDRSLSRFVGGLP